MKRALSMFRPVAPLLLVLLVGACSSAEEKICKREMQLPDVKAMASFGKAEPEAESLKKCVELFPFMKEKLELDDAAYAEYVSCREKTTNLGDIMNCTAQVSSKSVEKQMGKVIKDAEAKAVAKAEAKAEPPAEAK